MLIHSYSLTFTATEGPLTGESGGGTFSFLSPDVPSYGVVTGLRFHDLDMTWNGKTYTESDLMWGYSQHLPDGRLDLEFGTGRFGTGCTDGRCSFPGFDEAIQISYYWGQQSTLEDFIAYTLQGDGTDNIWNGDAFFSYLGSSELPEVPVPEPSALALLVVGLLGLALRRQRHPLRLFLRPR